MLLYLLLRDFISSAVHANAIMFIADNKFPSFFVEVARCARHRINSFTEDSLISSASPHERSETAVIIIDVIITAVLVPC